MSHNENALFGDGVRQNESKCGKQDGCGVARGAGVVALPLIVRHQDFGPRSSAGRSARQQQDP